MALTLNPPCISASRSFTRCLLCLISCLAPWFTACREGKKPTQAAPPPVAVTVATVEAQDTPVIFEYVAQTQSSHLVNIQARVNGFLDRRMYTEGEVVKAGQVLFQMDPKPFQVQLEHAKAALAKQQAAYTTARLNYERTKILYKQEVVSQKDMDDATGQFQSAEASVEGAKAQVETAKLNLSYTTITSPVAGFSGAALQTDGTYINPQNSLLTEIAVISPMWVNFSMSENDMAKYRDQVAKGLVRPPKDHSYVVEVVLGNGLLFPHTGRITFAEPSFNVQTGTFLIRASVDNPDGTLRPNQYVHVRLKGAVRPRAILLPQRAVQEGSKGQFVWVVATDNKVELRPVVVGNWHENEWFVLEGLKAGEQVVVDGGLTLQPGAAVSVSHAR